MRHRPSAAIGDCFRSLRRRNVAQRLCARILRPRRAVALPVRFAQLLKQLAPSEPSERAHALKAAHYRMSTIIAMRQAELLMASEGIAAYGRAPPKYKPKALYRPETEAGPLAGPPLRIQ